MKRVLLGFVLAVVFYFAACMAIGGIAGGIAGANNPHNASEAGAQAGADAVQRYGTYIMGTALAFGVLGAWLGLRPAKQ